MHKLTLAILLVGLSVSSSRAQANWRSKVAPEILAACNQEKSSDLLISFSEQANLSAAKNIHGKTAKARFVFDKLMQTAQHAQARAWKLVRENNGECNSLFIVNGLSVTHATPQLVRQLAELDEVAFISSDPWIQFSGPVETSQQTVTDRGNIEWGVQRVRAPEVWSLGYTGQGITVGGEDTGYDWTHPAIKPHYRGWNAADSTADHAYNWHDAIHELNPLNADTAGNLGVNPCGLDLDHPCDDNSHGTHTMGTMTGDDGMGNQTGVAPGAKWIGCRNMERGWGRPSSYIECFQWFLAPTDLGGANADPSKAPDVINNSWYCAVEEGCTDLNINEMLHAAVINLKTAGVMVVVSNGNFGPACATTYGPPAYFEESFSVGAFNIVDSIAGFSSRGPVTIDGSGRLKPNVAAPGVNVRSSTPNGHYANFSGTSMAGPHVVGVVALVLSARPDLSGEVETIEDILEQTARPLFDTIDCGGVAANMVPNNTFGFGAVDAYAAVQAALAHSPVSSPANEPEMQVKVMPNPVQNDALFEIDHANGKTTLEIWNSAGQMILQREWQISGASKLSIPCAALPAGVYFWKAGSDKGVVSGKMIRQ